MVTKDDIVKMKASSDIPGLIQCLQEYDPVIRADSAAALGKLGDSSAVEPLISALKDKESNVRIYAAEALGELRDKRAVYQLITTLRDYNKRVQRNAVKALGDIGDSKAVEPLIQLLKDKDRHVRAQTVIALGDIADPLAIEALEAVTSDEDDVDDITIGDMAQENIVKIKSSHNYLDHLRDKAKKLEKAKRHAEASQVVSELRTWESAAGQFKSSQVREAPPVKPEIGEGEKTEMITDYLDKKPPEGEPSEVFNNCPFCGKKFSFKKTPKFCPFCTEELG